MPQGDTARQPCGEEEEPEQGASQPFPARWCRVGAFGVLSANGARQDASVQFQRAGTCTGEREHVGIVRLQGTHDVSPEHEARAVSVSIPGLGPERGLSLAPACAGKPCAVRSAAKEKDRRVWLVSVMKFEDRVPRATVWIGNKSGAHRHSGTKVMGNEIW